MTKRVCELCKQDITADEAFMNMPEEKVAHEKCFSLGSCPVCQKDLRVVEDLVGANGKKYHLNCFKCAKCQNKLESYVVKEDKLICKPCALAEQQTQLKPKGTCTACNKAVEGNQKAFQMEDKMYHAECFVCSSCKGDLTGGCTFVEDKICCAGCFNKMKENALEQQRQQVKEQQAQRQQAQQQAAKSAIVCDECKQPITTQALQALGRSWHVACIKCFKCRKQMTGKLFPVNNEPHCQECVEGMKQEDIKRQQDENARKQQQHNASEQERRAAFDKQQSDKEAAALSDSLQQKAKLAESAETVKCNVCQITIKGAYQELGGIVHCNDCAEVVQKAIGNFFLFFFLNLFFNIYSL